MENIKLINISELQPHPQQAEIYGEIELDEDFLISIEDRGIIQPLLVTYSEIFEKNTDNPQYTIISGHRRYFAAKEKKYNLLPCFIREYDNSDEATLEFLISNKQREKTNRQRLNEFLAYKQMLCQLGKLFRNKGLYLSTIYENEAFGTMCQTLKINPENPLNSIEILKNITGFSKRQQKYVKLVYDTVELDRLFDKWRSMGLKLNAEDKIYKNWDNVRKACDSKEITLLEAYNKLSEYVKLIEKGLLKNKKPKELTPKKEEPKALLPSHNEIFKALCLPCENKNMAKYQVDYQGEFKEEGLPSCKFGLVDLGAKKLSPAIMFDNKSYIIQWEILTKLIISLNSKSLLKK